MEKTLLPSKPSLATHHFVSPTPVPIFCVLMQWTGLSNWSATKLCIDNFTIFWAWMQDRQKAGKLIIPLA